jgi:hypothetical protein
MFAGLDDLNSQIRSMETTVYDKKKPGMQMVDLLEQRKLQQQRALGDYSERAKEIPEDKPEGEAGETKSKKKRKKTKNKKKNKDKQTEEQDAAGEGAAATSTIELPESIKEAGRIAEQVKKEELIHSSDLQRQTGRWEEMLEEELAKEKNDEDSSNLSQRDDDLFDDNFMQRDEMLNPDSIDLEFDEGQQAQQPDEFKVDLSKCKESLARKSAQESRAEALKAQTNSIFSNINDLQKISQMESSFRDQNTSLNNFTLSDQRKE